MRLRGSISVPVADCEYTDIHTSRTADHQLELPGISAKQSIRRGERGGLTLPPERSATRLSYTPRWTTRYPCEARGGKDGGARSVLKAPSRSNANLPDLELGQGLAQGRRAPWRSSRCQASARCAAARCRPASVRRSGALRARVCQRARGAQACIIGPANDSP
jgi:hypothetical protein